MYIHVHGQGSRINSVVELAAAGPLGVEQIGHYYNDYMVSPLYMVSQPRMPLLGSTNLLTWITDLPTVP